MSDNNPDIDPERARRPGADGSGVDEIGADEPRTDEPRMYSFPAAETDAPQNAVTDAPRSAASDASQNADSGTEFDSASASESDSASDSGSASADGESAAGQADDSEPDPWARYVPPALVDPDAASRAVAAAAAARAAERADAAAKLAGLSSRSAAVDEAIGYTPPARLTAGSNSENHAPAARSADVVQFTAPDQVIGRSNYVITPDSDVAPDAQPALVPARATATEPVQATPDPADAVFTRPEQRIVYVEAPAPPQKKGNRGVGSLLAVVSALAFAILFAAVITLVFWVTTGRPVTNFIGVASFYVPVAAYALGFVLLVLLLNRAAWWAYILGSIFVGLFVYFGTAGVLLLLGGVIQSTPAEAADDFARVLADPLVIAAAILGREVALWTGAAIASRGRRVKAKNAKALEAYNRDMEERKAGNGRAAAGSAA
ncbi:MAG: hypothetical protein ABWY54_08105 [Glaciihabitans sp.]